MSDAFSCFTENCQIFGYDYFLLGEPPEFGSRTTNQNVLLTNLPLYVLEDLVALDLFSNWSAMKSFQLTSAPFHWSAEGDHQRSSEISADRQARQGQREFKADTMLVNELGIRGAHCIPLATKNHRRTFLAHFSIESLPEEIDPALLLQSQILFDRVEEILGQRKRNTVAQLNERELECLSWAAAGKTSSEIATIIELSEHTINHYLNACCRKLDCMNRTQAVAKAIRHDLIP